MAHKGKHALITGGSRGIGRGIALKLAENGVKVAVAYYKNESAANDTLAKVKERGSSGFIVQGDVNKPGEIGKMFARLKKEFGKLDYSASNARPEVSAFSKPPMEISRAEWATAT